MNNLRRQPCSAATPARSPTRTLPRRPLRRRERSRNPRTNISAYAPQSHRRARLLPRSPATHRANDRAASRAQQSQEQALLAKSTCTIARRSRPGRRSGCSPPSISRTLRKSRRAYATSKSWAAMSASPSSHAVGDASKLLTDEQRKSPTGFAPPASAAPAAAPMAGETKDM